MFRTFLKSFFGPQYIIILGLIYIFLLGGISALLSWSEVKGVDDSGGWPTELPAGCVK